MENHQEYSRHPFEPKETELPSKPNYHFQLDRRKFFQISGGGLIVAFVIKDLVSFKSKTLPPDLSTVAAADVDAWIHIGKDGMVNVYTGKVEVGQNIRTSLAQIVAEELMVAVSSIIMIMGDTDLVPYDAGTFGSRSTPQMGTQLRKAAATARQALLELAAKKWNIETTALKTENGMVVNTSTNEKTGYGDLTKGEKIVMTISDNVPVIAAKDWKVAGRSIPKVDQWNFLTGKHVYVSDMKLPGMLYGKVLRAPSYGSKLIEADLSNANKIPGVVVVKDGDFIGVAAPDISTASKALQSINGKWEEKKDHPSNNNIFDYLVKNTSGESSGRNNITNNGDIERGLTEADHKHSATYHIQYIAHVPLEPRAAVAEWKNGKLTVWTGTQRPFGVQQELADVFRIDKKNVRVIMPDTGSGYGGKHSGETAIEAARLSKEANKPVKVVWTREEEFTWAYFRPGGVIEVNAGLKKDGSISAWKFTNYNSGGAGLDTQYNVGNKQVEHVRSNSPLRQGSYRGLAAPANVFARECHIDDLARMIKMDPLDFRIKNLKDDRLIKVLQAAAQNFGWNGSKPAGHGYGIACGFEKGGYVGTCVEIKVNGNKEVKIVRISQSFECGAIINPHHLENQVMGSVVQALGGALFEVIEFANGKILNSNLSSYRVPRFSDIPKIEVVLLDRKDLPSAGAGEAAMIGIAPAIRNAILDATGKALNTLPLLPNGLLA
jgi:nicotinate dehydrogenase subunit B